MGDVGVVLCCVVGLGGGRACCVVAAAGTPSRPCLACRRLTAVHSAPAFPAAAAVVPHHPPPSAHVHGVDVHPHPHPPPRAAGTCGGSARSRAGARGATWAPWSWRAPSRRWARARSCSTASTTTGPARWVRAPRSCRRVRARRACVAAGGCLFGRGAGRVEGAGSLWPPVGLPLPAVARVVWWSCCCWTLLLAVAPQLNTHAACKQRHPPPNPQGVDLQLPDIWLRRIPVWCIATT